MNNKRSGLGRGLSSLLGENNNISLSENTNSNLIYIPIENIQPGPWQARVNFDEDNLKNLVQSIKKQGVLNPLILTKLKKDKNKFYLVAGERRWRACQIAKIHEVPAFVYEEIEYNKAAEISLVENIQREDLNILEEAKGYNDLVINHKYSQEKISETVGKSRSHITNTLRLLKLPNKILDMIKANLLSAGHARTLIGNPRAIFLAEEIIKKSLSVREAEVLANKKLKKIKPNKNNSIAELEKDISNFLGLNIKINQNKTSNNTKVFISFSNDDQLNDFFKKLGYQFN